MSQSIFIQVRYSEDVDINGQKITFSDALYYPQDKWVTMKQEDIDAVKAERVANWTEAVLHPPKYIEPSKEMLMQELQELEEQKQNLEARKVELETAISAISVEPIEEEPIEEVKP